MSEMKNAITNRPNEVPRVPALTLESPQPDCASESERPATPPRKTLALPRSLVVGAVLLCMAFLALGLLICGVQKIREAAAHTSSTNNLHQIGLAILCWADSNNALPPAYGETPQMPGQTVSFFLLIHPYLDQWGDNPFPPPPDFRFPYYCAPLDPRNPQTNGTISYCTNGTLMPPPPQFVDSGDNGTVVIGRQPYSKECGGRASSLIMVMERSGLDGAHQWSNLNNVLGSPEHLPFVPQVGVEPSAYREDSPQGFTSRGCLVVLGDGSVRPIGANMSPTTWNWACDPTFGLQQPPDW